MRIIVEGCDNSGKTTLLNALAHRMQVTPRTRITRVGPQRVRDCNERDLTSAYELYDRCYWITDKIYEEVYGGKSVLTSADVQPFCSEDYLYVFVTASEDTIRERMNTRGDDLHTTESVLKARALYEEFFNNFPGRYIKIDTTKCNLITEINAVITVVKEYINANC